MLARVMIALTLIASALFAVSTVHAGGWASVRMVEGDPNPVAGQSWRATLLVKQHDRTPVDVDELTVHFEHDATGATRDITGVSNGELGHYMVDVQFDETGLWSWSATPAPFAATNMPSLEVVATTASATSDLPIVSVIQGSCAAPGGSLGELVLDRVDSGVGAVIASGVTGDMAFIQKYIDGDSAAVIVRPAADSATVLACGDLPNIGVGRPQAALLEPVDDSGWTGTVTLIPVDNILAASVTLAAPASPNVVVHISQVMDGSFDPAEITIPVGGSVTWINDAVMAHTITGAAKGFRDSGMLDPGMTFTQTFSEPGTYAYVCDPHPWMTGTIVVSG